MGNYSVPESIRKFKPKGTMVKRINGKDFYVYDYKCVIENGKKKTVTGKMIGKIIEGKGFIANNNYIKDDNPTTLEYGQYRFVLESTKDIFEDLKKVFCYDDAARIYAMAIISYVNGFTYLKDYAKFYEQSYLSLELNRIKMGYDSLSNLLDDLGRKETKVHEFEDNLIMTSSKEIAVDGHVIPNYSDENDLSDIGYKFAKLKSEQINLLMGYDVNTHRPLFQRLFNGSIVDKRSVQELMNLKSFSNVLFIVDRGFYSATNIKLFSSDGNRYIIPLSPNHVAYKDATNELNLDKVFSYKKGNKKSLIKYKVIEKENKTIYVFRDENQNAAECADYMENLEQGLKGFSEENFKIFKDFFGLIVLETNLETEVKDVYVKYKKRWSIETYYNFLKNQNHFMSLHGQDYYKMKGLSFIMLIVGLIQSNIDSISNQIKGANSRDILLESRILKATKTTSGWQITNQTKKVRTLFEKLGNPLTSDIQFIYL